jgi:hypothetical protein
MKAAFLAVAVLATAGAVFYFSTTSNAAQASGPQPDAHKALSSSSRLKALPLFFEPNRGQTAPQVKFLARGSGYSLFLTADEAVLRLQHSAVSRQQSATSVIRMRLDGANSSARISGASPLLGKSNYFIGNDPSKWRSDIPQFARVEYKGVYPGVDLVYYGDQGQLEYDFRVAPAADPNQIALSFEGAAARIDSGDLLLSTEQGDVRFHAPRVYQKDGNTEKAIAGSFRQLADNRIGFTVADYDHSRQLVIDPVLSYSSYLGGTGTESLVKVAVDANGLIYVAGSTDSADFPTDIAAANNPNNPPYQSSLVGATNIFIAVIDPTRVPPLYSCSPQPPDPPYMCYQQLVYATYLGSTGTDSLAGIAVDAAFSIYVAGTTTSTCTSPLPNANCFPTTSGAFQTAPTVAGTHGFLSKIGNVGVGNPLKYGLLYSTYLAGNGSDMVTGVAIDASEEWAYVTGTTTSTNPASDNFPANPNGYQLQSNSPGPPANPQFFASKIDTTFTGTASMVYSTYFGGGNPVKSSATGGGIAVDPAPASTVNMYITGTTNMLPTGINGGLGFPLQNAYQSCLDQASATSCSGSPTNTDAFVAKINPNQTGAQSLVYSTYVGGSGTETGVAIAVDTSGNAYITGKTNSTDWVSPGTGFQTSPGGGGNYDAFIAKIGNESSGVFPLNYFTYLGGSSDDFGQDIKVDSVQAAHVVGSTSSMDLPVTAFTLQPCLGDPGFIPPPGSFCPSSTAENAFVAVIGTTLSGKGVGDMVTFLGGSGPDHGTGVAIDLFGATYAAGDTVSPNFPFPLPPIPNNPFQSALDGTAADAFISKIGASSALAVTYPNTSPAPNPVAAGTQVAFTFDITNNGPDNASQVVFNAVVPNTGLASNATAKVTSGTGSCGTVQGQNIACFIPTLAEGAQAVVEVDVTPAISANSKSISVSGSASANGGPFGGLVSQMVNVVDFSIKASTSTPIINAGDMAVFQVTFKPTSSYGYNATITPSQTTSPTMVTAPAPSFNPTTVTLSGSASSTTNLSIQTVARPVTTGSLLRGRSFYAAWLPITGLSLAGLGIGAGRKRRRWLIGVVLGLLAAILLLQPGCGSSSSSTTPTGGTAAGVYTITITGSAGSGASHNYVVSLQVN